MTVITKTPEDTIILAKELSRHLKERDVLALTGELGSGKTVFVKGILEGFGIKREKVISPSFVLMQEYKAGFPIFHFDLYRIKDLRELYLVGFEQYLSDGGVSVIEWADKAGELLPDSYLEINLKINSDKSRAITFRPYGQRYKKLIKRI